MCVIVVGIRCHIPAPYNHISWKLWHRPADREGVCCLRLCVYYQQELIPSDGPPDHRDHHKAAVKTMNTISGIGVVHMAGGEHSLYMPVNYIIS